VKISTRGGTSKKRKEGRGTRRVHGCSPILEKGSSAQAPEIKRVASRRIMVAQKSVAYDLTRVGWNWKATERRKNEQASRHSGGDALMKIQRPAPSNMTQPVSLGEYPAHKLEVRRGGEHMQRQRRARQSVRCIHSTRAEIAVFVQSRQLRMDSSNRGAHQGLSKGMAFKFGAIQFLRSAWQWWQSTGAFL
jgi:hypothetical protein